MKHFIKNSKLLYAFLFVLVMFSCQQKEWDDHFDRGGSLPSQNLYELIKQDKNLSIFLELIDISGYKNLLSTSQTYTVWAPSNEALIGVDVTNEDTARLIVSNHIARFNISTAVPETKMVRMASRKIYSFSDGGTRFGESLLLNKDNLAKNGILHKVDKRISYTDNLYEFINNNANTSKLWSFISTYSEERFDEELSIPLDVDMETGLTLYDTVTSPYNRLLEHKIYGLGHIDKEDSIYSVIVPTNTAWDAAYARISPYFKVYNTKSGIADSIQKLQTSLAILNDLIYRGKLDSPETLDSISSTSPFGTVIHDVAGLFSGGAFKTASNGLIYLTDDLRYDNTETWNKKIGVESESQIYRALGPNTKISTITVSPSLGVSNDAYVYAEGNKPSVQPSLTFSIPQVLSGKYDIYVVFVPEVFRGNSYAGDSTKVTFELTYLGADGRIKSKEATGTGFVTSGTKVVKMKVLSEFEFPISNYYDQLWFMEESNVLEDMAYNTKLLIMTNVNNSEFNSGKFKRRFLVDKIVFEPVRN